MLQPIWANRRLNVHRDLRNELEREHLHQVLGLVGRQHEGGAAADHWFRYSSAPLIARTLAVMGHPAEQVVPRR